MDQDASSKLEIPRSALLAVNRALTTIHSAVGLRPTLEAIAHGVTVSTPYQAVTVTIAEEQNAAELRVIAVLGPPDAVALQLNTTCQRTALVAHLAGGEAWGLLRFLPAVEFTDGITTYRPEYEPLTDPDAWQPQYELVAPLHAPDGELIGMLSMDRPRDGRIPPAWVNNVLELFAEQAAIAILNAHVGTSGHCGPYEDASGAREGRTALGLRGAARPRGTHLRHEAPTRPADEPGKPGPAPGAAPGTAGRADTRWR